MNAKKLRTDLNTLEQIKEKIECIDFIEGGGPNDFAMGQATGTLITIQESLGHLIDYINDLIDELEEDDVIEGER